MSANMSTGVVALMVNGRLYTGWETVEITRSIEQIAGSFRLTVSDQDHPIREDDACEVRIDGETVITGFIDTVETEHDAGSHSITVSGRDAAGELVDCAIDGRQFKDQTLLQIAESLSQPFGIHVVADVDIGAAFKDEKYENGQRIHDFLEQLARYRGVMLISDGQGSIRITRAATARAPASLVYGVNIKSGRASRSRMDRFSVYTVKSQSPDIPGEQGASQQAVAEDAGMRRTRPTVIVSDPQTDLTQRATWERNVRAGRAMPATHTVQGWHAAPHALWKPNTRTLVTDPKCRLDAAERLIVACTYRYNDQSGMLTEIRHLPPAAYDLLAEPEPESQSW